MEDGWALTRPAVRRPLTGSCGLCQGAELACCGYGPLLAVAAGAVGVGSRGMPARPPRPADRELCGVLRAASGRLVVPRAGRPAGEGVPGAVASGGCPCD